MSEIQALLEQGAQPTGPSAVRLADALLCVAASSIRLYPERTREMLRFLLPGRFRALYGTATIVHFHDIVDHLEHPDPAFREAARDVAVRLASDEVSLNPVAAVAANYEGKHRNEP